MTRTMMMMMMRLLLLFKKITIMCTFATCV